MSVRRFLLALIFPLTLPASARADEAPPLADIVCGSNRAGEACEVNGAAGTCVADTCTRLDYSQGVPPREVQRECMRCQVVAPPAPAAAPGAAAPVPAAPAPAAPAPAAPAATASSGCRVAPGTTVAPFLLLLFAPLLRRRRAHGGERRACGRCGCSGRRRGRSLPRSRVRSM